MSDYSQYELDPSPTNSPVGGGGSQLSSLQESGADTVLRRGNLRSMNFVKGQTGWMLDEQGNAYLLSASITGSLIATSIDIPDTTTANSFHVDADGDTWWGATTLGAAPASVTKAGAANFTSITIAGYASTSSFAGDGSDGDVTISAPATISRDMFYNNLTISSGGDLNPSGFRVFVAGTLTIASGGFLRRNGNAGTDGTQSAIGTGGAALASGSLPGSPASGNGGSGAGAGVAGAGVTKGLGAAGSAGGAGGNSGGAGGAAGALSGTVFNTPRSVASAYSLMDSQPSSTPASLTGSASSGGGGSGAGSGDPGEGGGGGGAGGVVVIFARTITNNGTISANGGAGGKGGDSAVGDSGGGGGGAGGAGGVVILVYSTFTGNAATATAGAAGAKGLGDIGARDGVAGTIGNAGNVYTISA